MKRSPAASSGTDYRYYGIVGDGRPKENPSGVVREWDDENGHSWAEAFTRNLRWENTDRLIRIREGRDDHDAELITEDVVERYVASATENIRREQQG